MAKASTLALLGASGQVGHEWQRLLKQDASHALQVLAPYSDETDRETFSGESAGRHTASPGQLLVFDNDFAYQPLGASQLRKMVLMVTIEGATFHNK